MAKSKRAIQEATAYADTVSHGSATITLEEILLGAEARLEAMKRIGVSKVRLEPMTWEQCEVLIKALKAVIAWR